MAYKKNTADLRIREVALGDSVAHEDEEIGGVRFEEPQPPRQKR